VALEVIDTGGEWTAETAKDYRSSVASAFHPLVGASA
jgi:hypothetical protein